MTSEPHPMLVKVARAIAEARAVPGSKPAKPAPWSSDVDKRAARAAIEALLEPTEDMVSRGYLMTGTVLTPGMFEQHCAAIWKCMAQKVLGESV